MWLTCTDWKSHLRLVVWLCFFKSLSKAISGSFLNWMSNLSVFPRPAFSPQYIHVTFVVLFWTPLGRSQIRQEVSGHWGTSGYNWSFVLWCKVWFILTASVSLSAVIWQMCSHLQGWSVFRQVCSSYCKVLRVGFCEAACVLCRALLWLSVSGTAWDALKSSAAFLLWFSWVQAVLSSFFLDRNNT